MRSNFSVEAPADHAVDLVALVEQELGEVGPVLAGDAGDQCALGCHRRQARTIHIVAAVPSRPSTT
jgi:hypothetical protein